MESTIIDRNSLQKLGDMLKETGHLTAIYKEYKCWGDSSNVSTYCIAHDINNRIIKY